VSDEELIFWIDRCLGGRVVPDRLRAEGISIRTYAELYPGDDEVPDARWIPEVTDRGWIIVTKDTAISRAGVELEVLRRSGAIYVGLSAHNMTGPEQADCLLRHWRTIEGIVRTRKRPVVVRVTRSDVLWHDGSRWRAVKSKKARR
jgi:hypothetical protein